MLVPRAARRGMILASVVLVLFAATVSPAVISFGIAAGAALVWCWLLDSRRDS